MEQQKFVRKNTTLFDAQQRNERKRNRRTAFYIFLFVFISLGFLAVCVAVFLNVTEVNIIGNMKYSYEEIMEYVPITVGDNIYSFDSDKIEENIIAAFPYIKTVEVKRDLPTTVEITITEEMPYFASELAGDTYIMSSDLKVLERLPNTKADSVGIVTISLNNIRQCIVGKRIEFVSDRMLNAVSSLYKNFADNYIEDKIVSVNVRSRFDIYLNYDNRIEVYIGDTDDLDIKMRFLVAIIDKHNENVTGTIDISNPHEASVALS